MIPALGRQRKADLCEFQASQVYRMSSRTGSKNYTENPVSKTNKQTTTKEKETALASKTKVENARVDPKLNSGLLSIHVHTQASESMHTHTHHTHF